MQKTTSSSLQLLQFFHEIFRQVFNRIPDLSCWKNFDLGPGMNLSAKLQKNVCLEFDKLNVSWGLNLNCVSSMRDKFYFTLILKISWKNIKNLRVKSLRWETRTENQIFGRFRPISEEYLTKIRHFSRYWAMNCPEYKI